MEAHAPRVIAVMTVSSSNIFEVWQTPGTSNASMESAAPIPAVGGVVFFAIPDLLPPSAKHTGKKIPPERGGGDGRHELLEVTALFAGIASC